MKNILRVLVLNIALICAFSAHAQSFNCFPSCLSSDGRVMGVAHGDNTRSLGGQEVSLQIVTDAPALDWGIYDADAGGSWDIPFQPFTTDNGYGQSVYRLYADPLLTGDSSGLTLVQELFSDDPLIVNAEWLDFNLPHAPAAFDPANNRHSYLLVVEEFSTVGDSVNTFKVRADGIFLVAMDTVLSFAGSLTPDPISLTGIFPNWPSTDVTTYNGNWQFNLLVTESEIDALDEITLWDGDLDHGNGIDSNDTDDADTANTFVQGVNPPFPTSNDAKDESATGGANVPQDNSQVALLQVGESITVEIIDPVGNRFLNDNPSGDREWEKFTIRENSHPDGCDSTVADFCVDKILPGLWKINVYGMDLNNLNFYYFGYLAADGASKISEIGNYVWHDEDSNGIQDAGEPGISGVVVQVRDSNGNIVGSAVTDANGYYSVGLLLPGNYTVEVDETTLPVGASQTINPVNSGADFGNQSIPYTINLTVGEFNYTADFGYNWGDPTGNSGPGALGDRVWFDTNQDGFQDLEEIGLSGVDLFIYWDSNADGVVDPNVDNLYVSAIDKQGNTGTGVTTTQSDGTYIFSDLQPGIYKVVVDTATLPADLIQSGDPDAFGTVASVLDNQTTNPVVVAPGDVFINVDFGYYNNTGTVNSIGDTVFLDLNANGVEDLGEPGIANVGISLLDSDNQPVAVAYTDSNGFYLFDGLPDGDYLIQVSDAFGSLMGLSLSADPDDRLDGVGESQVQGGAQDLTMDFGYVPSGHTPDQGMLGDTIFLDTNGNGLFESGEGISNVRVSLYDQAGVEFITSTTTNSQGLYLFGNLDPLRSYTIRVDQSTLPSGVVNSVDPDGGNDSESSVDLTNDPDGTNDGVNLDQDFGYVAELPGSIGDYIWLDVNANGTNDGLAGLDGIPGTDDDEPGIEGVTLDLYLDSNGDGLLQSFESRVASAVTDVNGQYLFQGLAEGDYLVDVSDLNNILTGHWLTSGQLATNNQSQPDPLAVPLSAGENVVYADFGYQFELASIGDFVWFDANADGIQSLGEPGISGVEVSLTIDYVDGTQITLNSFTDDNGIYNFANLLADESYNGDSSDGSDEPVYTLTIIPPAGLVGSPIDVGTDDNIDADNPNGELGDAIPGGSDKSNDFGLFDKGSISGNVSEDLDRDGTVDGPLFNVTVELFEDSDRNGIPDSPTAIDSTTTDVDGNYEFTNVDPGSYLVVETDPSGYDSLSDGDATIIGDDDFPPANDPTDDNIIPVTVTVDTIALEAEDDDGNNFVDSPLLAGLGDTVWFDHNANGVQDTGENGIPNVSVNLISNGSVIDTALTDGNGFYEFTGIVAGTYTVEVDPASFTTALEQTHDFDDPVTTNPVTANSATVSLTPGETNNDVDFGYRPLGSIGDTVWNDINANGVQDGGELGIEGVDVTLTGPVNDSATTDGNGFYEFVSLPAGAYTVTVSGAPLSGLQQTHDLDDPVTTNPATPDTTSVDIVLNATEDALISRDDVDFGYREQAAITGTVTEDTTGDGVGDSNQENVTVELYADTDGDGQPDGAAIDTTTTGNDGSYSFTDVAAGDYVVVEVTPTGLTDVSDQDTTPDGDSFDDDTSVDDQIAVSLSPGETDTGNDFVDENKGSISGNVLLDTTGDGAGDTPQGGVTVELYADTDGDGNPDGTAIDSTTTAGDGSYSFDPVAPGKYVVVDYSCGTY